MRARPQAIAILSLLACVGGGCRARAPTGHLVGDVYVRGEVRYRVGAPPAPWLRLDSPADLAWYEPGSGAVIATHATCRGHHDEPLPTLVHDLTLGTTGRVVLLAEDVMLDGRAARHEVVQLLVDGVPLVYDLYVVKRNGCVYDLTLVAPLGGYDAAADPFVDFVAYFHGLEATT